ncbi:MAG: hypothetical protein EPO55_20315 [Reyranella sp.]|uniref:hypothetical protein n=1 Tax=Reyranella sp. TaxID=1929291 RepID=UPI00121A2B14|nr:hypothetical protein [Reyranella sp.]TAJ36872.1 MAG: hypothetical protein EPO55_20315 [Reyranella sp.]
MALPSAASAACNESGGPNTVIETQLDQGLGATTILLRLLPGGTAEYIAGGTCTLLAFTAFREGSAIYTDDGLGRGLTVSVAPDRTLTVSHASGWTARSR